MCIVSITRPEPRVYQPDPPGLIHDDPRLLPPWRGSSLFWGKQFLAAGFSARPLARCGDIAAYVAAVCQPSEFVHRRVSFHKFGYETGVPPSRPRTVDG
jgi:hypothetical protein